MSKKTEVQNNNNNALYIVIILLLVVIAVLAFFVGKNMGNTWVAANPNGSTTVATDLKITVIDDTRCTSCATNDVVNQLKQTPFLAAAEYEMKDFADEGIEDYIKENNITVLPAVVFSTNQIGDNWAMTQYLTPIANGEYSLQIGSTFDPFAKRSDRGFLQIEDKELISDIIATSHIEWEEAKILWLEYSDVNCHFCKKMVSDGTVESVSESLPSTFSHAFINFIGVGGSRTQSAAEALECIASNGWNEAYNYAFKNSLSEWKDSINDILWFAEEKWADKAAVQSCIDNGESKDLVAKKYNTGQNQFGITGTPGNVILNTETGEYEVVSGAYPADTFVSTINSLVN